MPDKPDPVVFVHVPKTAGTSICRTLGIRHTHAPWWMREHGLFEFTIVRNPWEHARSCWNNFTHLQYPDDDGFQVWCKAGFPDNAHPPGLLVDQLERAGPHLDEYYRFEDIEEWYPRLRKRVIELGVTPTKAELAHFANEGRGGPRPQHTKETAAIVAERQAALIERFGYTYDG